MQIKKSGSDDADVKQITTSGFNQLMLFSRDGKLHQVRVLLEKGADANYADQRGMRALFIASANGHVDVVRALLEKKAGIDLVDENGWTALMFASLKGQVKVVSALLENGANVNCLNQNGRSALWLASQRGYVEVVRALIAKGADVDCTDLNGITGLWMAAKNGQVEVVRDLLKNGAALNQDGIPALWIASQNGHSEVVIALLENGAAVNSVDEYGVTALRIASHAGHVNVVRALVEKGAAVNLVGQDSISALRLASQCGYVQIVRVLLENGGLVNYVDQQCVTALKIASQNGHVEVVRLLLENDSDVHYADRQGLTALWMASQNGHIDAVNALLEKGAKVNHIDQRGATALWIASQNGHVQVVQTLLKRGADVNCRAQIGFTVIEIASAGGHANIVRALLEAGADLHPAMAFGIPSLAVSAKAGHHKVVRVLMAYLLKALPLASINNFAPSLKAFNVLYLQVNNTLQFITDGEIKKIFISHRDELRCKIINLPGETLQDFFKARCLICRWERAKITEVKLTCILEKDDHISDGIIRGYLKQLGISTEWHREQGLTLDFNDQAVRLLSNDNANPAIADLSRIVDLLKQLAMLVSVLCGVESWQTTPEGFEALISKKKPKVTTAVYLAKQNNIVRLLEYVWQQCGLERDASKINLIESNHQQGAKALQVTFECLSQPRLLRLLDPKKLGVEKKTLLQRCNHVALLISRVSKDQESAIPNLLALEKILTEEQQQQEQERNTEENRQEQPRVIRLQPRTAHGGTQAAQTQNKNNNKNKSNKKKKQQNEMSVASAISKPKASTIPATPHLPPQPAERGLDPRTIAKARSVVVTAGNDNSFWATTNQKNKALHPRLNSLNSYISQTRKCCRNCNS